VKAVTELFPFSQKINLKSLSNWGEQCRKANWLFILFCVEILFIPLQIGRHFWPSFSFILGERIDYLSPTLFVNDIPILIAFIYFLIKRKIHLKITFLLVVAYLSLSAFFSQSPFNGWYGLLKFLEFSFFIFWVSGTNFKTKILPYLFIPGIFLESIISLMQYSLQRSVGGILWFLGERTFNASTPGIANASISGVLILRPYGTFPHPNVLAGFLVISMVYVGSLLFNLKEKYAKLFILSILILGTVALLLTLSRIAIILWCLVVIATGIKQITKNKKNAMKIVIGIGAVIIVTIFLFPNIADRFGKISFRDEAVVQRIALMQNSFLMIEKSPLFGVGINNFLISLPEYESALRSPLLLQPVHNMFLLVFSETGLVGLTLFIWFLGLTFYRIYKALPSKNSAEKDFKLSTIISFGLILTIGFFDHYFLTLQQGQLLFAFIIGMCWRKSMLQ